MDGATGAVTTVVCPGCGSPLRHHRSGPCLTCAACGSLLFLSGTRGILPLLAPNTLLKGKAIALVKAWLSGPRMAAGVAKRAAFHNVELIYVPVYRFQAQLFYLGLGVQVLTDDRGQQIRKPAEHRATMPFAWAVPACELPWTAPAAADLLRARTALFHRGDVDPRARIFEPVRDELAGVLEMARMEGLTAIRSLKWLSDVNFERYAPVMEELDLVYYPLWIVPFRFRKREYQAIVDGTTGRLLDGAAPGSDLFRAVALVATLFLPALLGSSALADMPRGVIGSPVLFRVITFSMICAGFLPAMLAGYHVFRFGGEVQLSGQRRGGWRWLARLVVEKYGDIFGKLAEMRR